LALAIPGKRPCVRFLGLIAIPLAIGLVDVRALRRPAGRFDRALSSASLALCALCLVSVPWWEAQFWWKRYEVLRADPALLERLGRHIVVGFATLTSSTLSSSGVLLRACL